MHSVTETRLKQKVQDLSSSLTASNMHLIFWDLMRGCSCPYVVWCIMKLSTLSTRSPEDLSFIWSPSVSRLFIIKRSHVFKISMERGNYLNVYCRYLPPEIINTKYCLFQQKLSHIWYSAQTRNELQDKQLSSLSNRWSTEDGPKLCPVWCVPCEQFGSNHKVMINCPFL